MLVVEVGEIEFSHETLQENWPFEGGAMPGLRPCRRPELARERCGMSWFEVPRMAGSLGADRSACRT
jgi:hypothetical protein